MKTLRAKRQWQKPAAQTETEALRAHYEHELCQLRAKERVNGINVSRERSVIEKALAQLT